MQWQENFLAIGALVVMTLGMLLVLVAGDLRRRRLENTRTWYKRRLHTALDRVESFKLEIEPPLDGVDGFISAEAGSASAKESEQVAAGS